MHGAGQTQNATMAKHTPRVQVASDACICCTFPGPADTVTVRSDGKARRFDGPGAASEDHDLGFQRTQTGVYL